MKWKQAVSKGRGGVNEQFDYQMCSRRMKNTRWKRDYKAMLTKTSRRMQWYKKIYVWERAGLEKLVGGNYVVIDNEA